MNAVFNFIIDKNFSLVCFKTSLFNLLLIIFDK